MFAQQHGPLRPTLTHYSPPVNPYRGRVHGSPTRGRGCEAVVVADGDARYNADVRSSVVAFLAAACLPLAACGADSRSEPQWEGPPPPDASGRLAVDEFNEYLAGIDDETGRSPVAAAITFLGLDDTGASVTSIVARATAEGSGPTVMTVTLDRLADDSVRAQRFVLTFTPDGDGWTLRSARVGQRCWPGRGHATFSPEPCV